MADKIDKSRRSFLLGAIRKVKNEKSTGPEASTAEAVDTIKQANALYIDGKWEEAREKYKECIDCDKNDADVRYRCGVCLYKVGKYRQAKLELERALHVDRGYKDALLYLGLTMVRLEKPDKAVALWKQFFNPKAIAVQRELNLQIGMLEQGLSESTETIAQAVEEAIEASGDAVG